MKNLWLTYLLWALGGFFGLHHFYLGRDRQAFAYWCTIGGGFGVGVLIDFFKIPSYVSEVNESNEYITWLRKKMTTNSKPPFSIIRFGGEVLLGYVFGVLWYYAVPLEEVYGYNLHFLTYLAPLAISLGVHTIGNIGREQGNFSPALASTILSFALSQKSMPEGMFWCAVSASLGFTFKAKKWRTDPPPKHGICRRMATLGVCGILYLTLLATSVYFNAEIVDKNGERIKFRNAAINFLNSPMWEEIKESFQQLYNIYKIHGWENLYRQLVDQLDPHGERRALKVLELPNDATKSDIVAKWRMLSKEWHPDRHKDPIKKKEAHERFMEYQDAYQKLIKIRAKVDTKTSTSSNNANDEL